MVLKNKKQLANELAGSGPAGDLLYRLCYWWPKARVVKHGSKWIARRREDMAAECGISPRKYDRGLAKLKKLRLVETCQGQFGGLNVTHFRLLPDACRAMGLGKPVASLGLPDPASLGSPSVASLGSPRLASSYTIQGSHDGDDKTGMTGELPLAKPPAITKDFQEGQNVMAFPKKGHLAKDVIKPTVHQRKHGPDTVTRLEHVWKTELSAEYGEFVAGWTLKQKGIAKHFMTACAEHKPSDVLRFAIQNWSTVVSYAQYDHGLKKGPGRPELPFLLVNIQSAINCMLDGQKTKSPAPAQPSDVIMRLPAAASTPKPASPAHVPATLEEVKEILGEDW